jgi:hypothetical protein
MSAEAQQLPPKPVLLFAAHALALTLLIGFWPTPRTAYPELFHAHANALLRGWDVQLDSPRESEPVPDTVMVGPSWRSSFSVERLGWWPSAALVALLLATPLTPLRRAAAVLIGLALLDAFALGRIAIEIAYASAAAAEAAGAPLPRALQVLLRVGSESLTATIPSAAAVLVCWIAIARPRRAIDLAPLVPR